MLIILEGCDGAGKSTMVNALVNVLSDVFQDDTFGIMRAGPPTHDDPFEEYVEPLADYEPLSGRHIICDRWHLGEAIYPTILNRNSILDMQQLHEIEMILSRKGALMVHLFADADVIKNRIGVRGDDLITIEHIDHIINLYVTYTYMSLLDCMHIDTTPGIDQYTAERILSRALASERLAKRTWK